MKVKWYAHDRIIKQILFEFLITAKKYAQGRLLDVGCGDKPYEALFLDTVSEYIGVDLPISRSANKNIKRANIYNDINKGLPFRDASFDTVLCTEVLEHIPEPDSLIAESNRVLRKEGYLILTTPQVWGLHEEPCDYYRYTKYGLEYLMKKNNFKVVLLRKEGGLFMMIGQRLSSFIHYNYVSGKNIFLKLIFKPIYIIFQQICLVLDTLYEHRGDTLGNMLVAKKL